jgi:hypothetical protein
MSETMDTMDTILGTLLWGLSFTEFMCVSYYMRADLVYIIAILL